MTKAGSSFSYALRHHFIVVMVAIVMHLGIHSERKCTPTQVAVE